MKLDTATVANVARGAGFYGDRLETVTALALAASGGNTHYRHVAGLPGTGDWRGLWALNVDAYPDYAGHDLHDPHVAAQAAKQLTDAHDGFGWSDQYRAGTYRHVLGRVAGKTSNAMHVQSGGTPVAYHGAEHIGAGLMLESQLRRAALAGRPKRETPKWLQATE